MFLKIKKLRDGRFIKIEFIENLFDPFTIGFIISIIGMFFLFKCS